VISAFATIKEDPTATSVNVYPGKIVRQSWGYGYIDEDVKIQPIDRSMAMPLYSFKEIIPVDATWCMNITAPIETTIGRLLFNLLCLVPAFDTRIPYINGPAVVSKIEDIIAPKLQNTPPAGTERSTEYIYVDEYIRFADSLQYISSLSQITCWAATEKNIRAPDGIKAFKAKLITKYGDSLKDPVQLAAFEAELRDYDEAFMKGDPSNGTFVAGKVKNIARKKMFLSIGSEKGFTETLEAAPILNSLDEGWPTDPEQFTVLMNSSRSASYSRGSETVKGGVSAKVLLRAANNFRIIDTDCQSKLGITRTFDDSNIEQLVGRYILTPSLVLVEKTTDAVNYLNRDIIVRSPMWCQMPGDTICKVCSGVKLAQFPTGITIPVTEISSIILAASMAAMHAQVLSTATIDVQKHFT
jgi:hypothetical protein